MAGFCVFGGFACRWHLFAHGRRSCMTWQRDKPEEPVAEDSEAV